MLWGALLLVTFFYGAGKLSLDYSIAGDRDFSAKFSK
jgi:hypothetical protein